MGRTLTDGEVNDLFESYRYTARRLEPRDTYNTKPEDESRRQLYAAGQLTDFSYLDPWVDKVSGWRSRGKRIQRVRVVTEPLSLDARYLLGLAKVNVRAGDEIRYLPRRRAEELDLDLPDQDYWIFDATTAAIIHFDDDDWFTAWELVDDPAEIVSKLHHFDAAWHYSVSRDEFAAMHGVVDE
ncbi:hypothetical protein EV193_101470 [Herbihabitans rhizosphaerae]|uniref:DUF6879 domain-containing protein n=1 Tax=Herbihabitans rhizosphaerae TaxID=1872711 RepID=A0A4Q7L5N8_9PSEU|nr:DUF6879 family protein [Herbihabitans rhizosphaerae]RZS44594.1 hypothetical protein EV193_101470 [Herbihabitans rhizosphaerae]